MKPGSLVSGSGAGVAISDAVSPPMNGNQSHQPVKKPPNQSPIAARRLPPTLNRISAAINQKAIFPKERPVSSPDPLKNLQVQIFNPPLIISIHDFFEGQSSSCGA